MENLGVLLDPGPRLFKKKFLDVFSFGVLLLEILSLAEERFVVFIIQMILLTSWDM
jgi:hypothetical protein